MPDILDDLIIKPADLLVMGVGNILWSDEGFGVRCAEDFHKKYRLEKGSRVMDGGTLGMYLLETIEAAKDLLIFDCADLHAAPGTIKVLEGDEVTLWSTTKISAHQTGLNEVLALAELQGKMPKRLAVVVVQPAELQDYGGSLTPAIQAAVPEAIEKGVAIARRWGYEVTERAADDVAAPLSDMSLKQSTYEELRPSETEAPRMGDVRFLPSFDKE